ncbi:uncharacterized protein LOC143575336 [Bidens hawaiensis]|uniref:uncharacterized protein LOC143575336 n=1 Tax=Bidens hawaiensis TaxID=980011 RepID=UPI00404AF69B
MITAARGVLGESSGDDPDRQPEEESIIIGESESELVLIPEIKGLRICTHFLTPLQQSTLLQSILQEGWFTDASHNQAMRFGDLPPWANELSSCIRELIEYTNYDPESISEVDGQEDCIFPSKLLNKKPLFDQLIANSYQPGEVRNEPSFAYHLPLSIYTYAHTRITNHFMTISEKFSRIIKEYLKPVYLNLQTISRQIYGCTVCNYLFYFEESE